jgi:Phage major capsid protein E
MSVLDIFRQDFFSVISLTDGINRVKFQPGRIGQLNLFSETSVPTIDVGFEEKDGLLVLVPPTARGAPGITITKNLRAARVMRIPHFQIDDAIMADEVQGVRAWNTESEVETVMGKVSERQMLHGNSLEATIEYMRIGALKGLVTYADGTTFNLYDFFGMSPPNVVDWDLDNATPADGILRRKSAALWRAMGTALGGIPFTGIRAFCGDAFFDDLMAHKEIRATYLNTPAAQQLRESYVANGMIYGAYDFGGIIWENYRGSVNGVDFINTDECFFVPMGVPNLFKMFIGPADYVETVNRPGQRMYSKQWQMENDKGINFETQGNWLNICTRPNVLMKGKRT